MEHTCKPRCLPQYRKRCCKKEDWTNTNRAGLALIITIVSLIVIAIF